MYTRRDFTKHVIAGGIASSIANINAFGFALNGQDGNPGSENKKLTLPDWSTHIDPEWVEETLVTQLLDYWLKASVMPNGFIQENLDRDWKPWGTQREASLNGQGRQLYCMAVGYELTKRNDYLEAVNK